jgi:hypothetical protein
MKVFGIDTIPLDAEAVVATAHTGLELAIVVDVTGSMNWTDSEGEVKIDSLKTAGHTLLTTLYGEAQTLPDVWISLVPYRAAVNIGKRTSWLNGYKAADFHPDSWRGCIDARSAPRDQNDDPPDSWASRFRAFLWPDGVAWNSWPPVVFDHSGPNWFCPVNEITSLTDQRSTIDDAIEALDARSGGGTQTSTGLVWAWRTISPRWQYGTSARARPSCMECIIARGCDSSARSRAPGEGSTASQGRRSGSATYRRVAAGVRSPVKHS